MMKFNKSYCQLSKLIFCSYTVSEILIFFCHSVKTITYWSTGIRKNADDIKLPTPDNKLFTKRLQTLQLI